MQLDQTAMWTAVSEHDVAFDGRFIYAVKTTGIYCRPSCPSRRPKRENVEFFGEPTAARQAGYRACSRCKPDASKNRTQMLVEKLRDYIDQHFDESVTLQMMGKAVGVSPFHLQRIFKRETGMTPKEYVDQVRLSVFKRELSAGRQITESLYEAGYSSPSHLYERSSKQLGMTPGTYKKRGAGEVISFAFVRTELGLLILGATERGVAFLQFGESEAELKQALSATFCAATIIENIDALTQWIERIQQYAQGKTNNIELPVDMKGTTFEQSVWRYLQQIPPGETRTYTQVAEAIGRPKAVRAVASACAANRIAMAIPCHRVIRTDGGLGGYRWGLRRKETLLANERSNIE